MISTPGAFARDRGHGLLRTLSAISPAHTREIALPSPLETVKAGSVHRATMPRATATLAALSISGRLQPRGLVPHSIPTPTQHSKCVPPRPHGRKMLTAPPFYLVCAWTASLVRAAAIGSGQSVTLENGPLVDSTERAAISPSGSASSFAPASVQEPNATAGISSATNRSSTSTNSSLGDVTYRCSAIYGVDLNLRSCLSAVASGLLDWRSTTLRT